MKVVILCFLAISFVVLTFAITTSPPVSSPAYAGKMNGKPGGHVGGGMTDYRPSKPTKSKSKSGY
jgi:hypothetical protein